MGNTQGITFQTWHEIHMILLVSKTVGQKSAVDAPLPNDFLLGSADGPSAVATLRKKF